MEPQLFHSIDNIEQLEQLVRNDDYAFEQKVDGMRMMTRIHMGGIEFLTRGGRPLKSTAAMQHFDAVKNSFQALIDALPTESEVIIDGEILTDTGKYVAFDMPLYSMYGQRIVAPYNMNEDRFKELSITIHTLMADNLLLVRRASDRRGKEWLLEEVYRAGGEGVMVKGKHAQYTPGERVKHSLKYKFTDTADVIIIGKNSGESKNSKRGGDKINYELGVYDTTIHPNEVIHVGNCSGIGKDDCAVGDVAEVKYLYRGAGGKLVQPTLIRRRDDKLAHECTVEQLRTGNKTVI